MRLWPGLRREASAGPPPSDDLLIIGDVLRRNVDDLMTVRDRYVQGGTIVLRGDLLLEPARAADLMGTRFKPFGYTPFLRREDGRVAVHAVPLAETVDRSRVAVNVVLFLLTCASTLLAGALVFRSPTFAGSASSPGAAWLLGGVPYAFTLLAILGIHELGHYFTARFYGVSVSLPYFIPAPPPLFLGTLGAIIRMRSPVANRNSLFDIAAAGPLAGLAVAIPAVLLGLDWSVVGRIPQSGAMTFGDSVLMRVLVHLKFGAIPDGFDVFVHPVVTAGWLGLLVTALNLFPVGQLDGGRIAYALFGRWHTLVGKAAFVALIVLGVITRSANWFVWAGLLFFLVGFRHAPPLDDVTPLSPGRRVVGAVCLILLVLLIPPVPIQID